MKSSGLGCLLLTASVSIGLAEEAADLETAPPVVVKTVPEAGSAAVDPALAEIKVTYSKKMADKSWSWSKYSKESFPPTPGEPKYLEDGRTCVLPVKHGTLRS